MEHEPSQSEKQKAEVAREFDEFFEVVPDSEITFMNHGYSNAIDGIDIFEQGPKQEDFGWVKGAHPSQNYSVNLVRHLCERVEFRNTRVLDIGCGRGGAAAYMATLGPKEVTGLDLSAGNIAFCQQNHRAPTLRFVEGDAEKLPFEDASFDVVTNIESSSYYPNVETFLREVVRVLKPGGWFLYTDVFTPKAKAKTFEVLGKSGLLEVTHEDITRQVAVGVALAAENVLKLSHDLAVRHPKHAERLMEQAASITAIPLIGYYVGREYHLFQMRKAEAS